jgi:hypothetical protein
MIGDTRFIGYCAVFKVRGEAVRVPTTRSKSQASGRRAPVSQNSTACGQLRGTRGEGPKAAPRGACCLPDPVDVPSPGRRAATVGRQATGRTFAQVLPRKEVIQPQLPLRLPCYDFTPVTSPTFDGSLPKGLGHRLRVLLTPVV